MRPTAAFRTLVLAALLAVMQQAEAWHALAHVGERLHRGHEHALLVPPGDGPCAQCALFAGGSSAVPSAVAAPTDAATAAEPPVFVAAAPTAAAPSSYRIRAPPDLL